MRKRNIKYLGQEEKKAHIISRAGGEKRHI